MRNVLVAVLALASTSAAGETVVVYVSLDQEHSEAVLRDFEKETGVAVDAQFDMESTKTVGMVTRLIAEKAAPAADVYWSNELATTIKLKRHGILTPYVSPSAADIPLEFKDPEGYWTGFAMRARVLIVNTDLVPAAEMPTSMWDLGKPAWRGKTCMARPETGTTATHAAALYVRDRDEADRYFDSLVGNEVAWLTGNAHCMREVAAGRFHFGWTDTDDFNVAREQGQPVAVVYPDTAPGEAGVLYIPNSVMLVKGGHNPEGAKRLIDWLLRPAIEERLAKSSTAQIPVRDGVPAPGHVKRPDQIGKRMRVDFEAVGEGHDRWVQHVRAKLAASQRSTPTLLWILVGVVVAGGVGFALLKRVTEEPT
ncbi:MAG: extracellular solute-binding protein [Planctomycetota bacterium]